MRFLAIVFWTQQTGVNGVELLSGDTEFDFDSVVVVVIGFARLASLLTDEFEDIDTDNGDGINDGGLVLVVVTSTSTLTEGGGPSGACDGINESSSSFVL